MRHVAVLAILLTTPALADDVCDDLWFTRNLIVDRAGYCFGSVLGKAMFDNDDCTGNNVSLSAVDQRQIALLRSRETQLECKVDTTKPLLELRDIDARRRLKTLPIRDEFESACIRWKGADLPLHAGTDPGTTIVGIVSRGDNVSFRHDSVGAWSYVTVSDPEWRHKSSGWTNAPFDINACEQFAG